MIQTMANERKMISVRLPVALRNRVDFVARNNDSENIKDRSSAIVAAIETWLPSQEDKIRALGVNVPKAR